MSRYDALHTTRFTSCSRFVHVPFAIGRPEREAWLGHMRDAVDSLDLERGVRKALLDYFEAASTAMINQAG